MTLGKSFGKTVVERCKKDPEFQREVLNELRKQVKETAARLAALQKALKALEKL